MKLSFTLGIEIRCTTCGVDRPLPAGDAERVLEGDVLYADTRAPCACGAKRIRVETIIDDGSPAQDTRSRPPPDEDR